MPTSRLRFTVNLARPQSVWPKQLRLSWLQSERVFAFDYFGAYRKLRAIGQIHWLASQFKFCFHWGAPVLENKCANQLWLAGQIHAAG